MFKNAPAGKYLRPARANPLPGCPLAAAFAAFGGKWKLTLLYWIGREESHFSSLHRRAAPISPKVLTEQLRELESDGLIERMPLGPVPAPVAYALTSYGRSVLPVVEAVRIWGEAHLQRNEGRVPAQAMACDAAVETGDILPAP
ncbi:MAG TPA: helix-turn-helix domain-containing protein [Pseudoxanthomonas sp.]|nr:helix-turn-helix domain-containing protein [Pseudoxanthomonas sp.]